MTNEDTEALKAIIEGGAEPEPSLPFPRKLRAYVAAPVATLGPVLRLPEPEKG